MKILFFFFFIVSVSSYALASEEKKNKPDKKTQEKKKKGNVADKAHNKLSQSLLNFSRSIDNFFGSERADDLNNKTTVRFSTNTIYTEGGKVRTLGDVRVNIQLPGLQRKLNLQYDDEEEKNPKKAKTAKAKNPEEKNNKKKSLLISSAKSESELKLHSDAGLKIQKNPQLFARMRLRKQIHFQKWSTLPTQEIEWVDRQGYATTTELPFDYQINKSLLLRLVNNIKWEDVSYIMKFSNGPVLFQKIDEKRALSYSAIIQSSNTPEFQVDDYQLGINFRQKLYKEWFYGEMGPTTNFPRSLNFHRNPAFHIKFEIVIGNV